MESEPARREILRERVRQLKTALKKSGIHYLDSCPSSPIIPILIGNEDKALTISKQLFEKGFWVPAVRYPTVPKGKARLRMTISAVHTPEEIKQLMDYLCGVSKKFF
ncbi:MAG: hypothetical protein COV74_02030 [Candidatus Omnitrophica bacterium CG11_big_fil_rev_8_21_14_0_20_45_26]|uniref:Aminotransferase class I/classII large domain-containing protein n=1 Tax=Candidatus Abzuiibacterium crystallinum TaxID=1974748 RepID=A0A2H0LRY1_9BACT|nr:MAG: hypothetical protein COV74_02030 [Candidatus Omnitrophica bacterium CG11_big_fil_rev_8_21_14_0_20_45_26]